MNTTVQDQMVIGIDFSIKDETGNELEVTEKGSPFFYIHGRDTLLPGIEQALNGKVAGEKITLTLEPQNAYGYTDEAMKKTILLPGSGNTENYQVGEIVCLEENEDIDWRVCDLKDGQVFLDGNHPWAGKTLLIDVTIISLRPATRFELLQNTIFGNGAADCGPGCKC